MDGFSIVMLIIGFVEGCFLKLFTGKSTSNHHCLGENVFYFLQVSNMHIQEMLQGVKRGKCGNMLKLLGGFDEESFIYHIFYLIGQDEVSCFTYL